MAALRDPAIKLFGRTIPLLDAPPPPPDAAGEVMSKSTNDPQKNEGIPYVPNELINVEESSFISKNSQKNDVQAVSSLDGKTEADLKSLEAKTESDGSGKEKVLKKPDKILPCPRCNSMETKFCYYNNYNVNQPRHFCRNCQRYWTAGGTMRNVPVGAGRRKHKHASHYHHVMIPSDNIVSARGDVSELMHHQALPCAPAVHSPTGPAKGSETVLKFGSEVPLCESMATVLNIGEHKNTNFPSSASGDGREEQSCSSSVVVSSCIENGNPDNAVKNEPNGMSRYSNGALPPIQCFPSGPALVFPWGPGWNNVAAMASAQCLMEPVHGLENGKENQLSWAPQMVMTAPGICSPVVPFPLVPPFWSCSTGWPNGMWSAPWPGSNCGIMPSNPSSDTSSGNNSPTLGKHSREASLQGEEKNEKNLWVPKTLRIDDPDEAAKSSIWATLGIKPDEKGLFKSFQWRALKNGEASESSPVIHANPAAFSRSQSFQEST